MSPIVIGMDINKAYFETYSSILTKMNNALSHSKENVFLVMESLEIFGSNIEIMTNRTEEYFNEKIAGKEKEFEVLKELEGVYVKAISDLCKLSQEWQEEQSQLDRQLAQKQRRVLRVAKNAPTAIRLKAINIFEEKVQEKVRPESFQQAHAPVLEHFKKQDQEYSKKLEEIQKRVKDCNDEIELLKKHKNIWINNVKLFDFESQPIFNNGLALFRLFAAQRSTKHYLSYLNSLGQDLFLDVAYFNDLEDEKLNQEYLFAIDFKNVIVFQLESATLFVDGISNNHIVAITEYLKDIINLFMLERLRRNILSKFEQSTLNRENNDFTSSSLNKNSDFEDAPDTASATPWTVEIRKHAQKEARANDSEESVNDLIAEITHYGPRLRKATKIEKGWRNFSQLSHVDFHCHVGDSNKVVVWRVVDEALKKVIIYYVGSHPETYKRVLKTAPLSK